MKKYLLLIIVLSVSSFSRAATVEVSWDPVTLDVDGNQETIGYYILYYGQSSRPGDVTHPSDTDFQYDSMVEVGTNVVVQRSDLQGNHRYYFSVAAADTGGNYSGYSAEVSLDVPEDPDEDPDNPKGGCSCSGVGLGGNLWFLGLALWLIRRRRFMAAT